MLRHAVEKGYNDYLSEELIKRETGLIESELLAEDAMEIFLERALTGTKGIYQLTADEMERHDFFTEEDLGAKYIQILAGHLIRDTFKEERELLVSILMAKGAISEAKSEVCPRKEALMSYIEDVSDYEVATIEAGEHPNLFVVNFIDDTKEEYKVYTEQECIEELARWYESDMECMCFAMKEISEVLGIPEEMLAPLGLLVNAYDGCGDGTKFLYQTLKKVGKLEKLASYAKGNGFGYLACDYNSTKVGDYYILDNNG